MPDCDGKEARCITQKSADGFGAAWVVRKALGDIEFHHGKYQEPPPDVTGKDVAEVAKQYGGGGHRNAAGFRVSFAQAQAFEV